MIRRWRNLQPSLKLQKSRALLDRELLTDQMPNWRGIECHPETENNKIIEWTFNAKGQWFMCSWQILFYRETTTEAWLSALDFLLEINPTKLFWMIGRPVVQLAASRKGGMDRLFWAQYPTNRTGIKEIFQHSGKKGRFGQFRLVGLLSFSWAHENIPTAAGSNTRGGWSAGFGNMQCRGRRLREHDMRMKKIREREEYIQLSWPEPYHLLWVKNADWWIGV